MRILLVEDDVALATFLRRSLEQQGYTVVNAPNGDSGLALAAEGQADLILLDLNLPRLDGMEVLRLLRFGGLLTLVLMLTGRAGVEERVRCLDGGADDFLAKPFSFSELAARCRAMLRRTSAMAESSVVRHGVLLVNRLHRSVHVNGLEITLTSKDFALLDYLLQHRGRAVSRPELLEKVWKMAPDSGTNVVDVYVNYLRRKLRTTAADPELIVTVRGSGYTLAPAQAPALPHDPTTTNTSRAARLPQLAAMPTAVAA